MSTLLSTASKEKVNSGANKALFSGAYGIRTHITYCNFKAQ